MKTFVKGDETITALETETRKIHKLLSLGWVEVV